MKKIVMLLGVVSLLLLSKQAEGAQQGEQVDKEVMKHLAALDNRELFKEMYRTCEDLNIPERVESRGDSRRGSDAMNKLAVGLAVLFHRLGVNLSVDPDIKELMTPMGHRTVRGEDPSPAGWYARCYTCGYISQLCDKQRGALMLAIDHTANMGRKHECYPEEKWNTK